jgi:integrase
MSTVSTTAAVLPFPVPEKKQPKAVKRLSTSGNITEKECTTRVAERAKYYDKGRGSCRGLYADISPTNYPAVFHVKCTTRDGITRPVKIGRFHPTELPISKARELAEIYKSQVSQGQDIVAERQAARIAVRDGKTINEVIELRIRYVSSGLCDTPEKKLLDNGDEPRRRDWHNTARHLRNYVGPTLGKKMIRDVTRQDVIDIDRAILEGKLVMKNGETCTPSMSNRRHMRRSLSSMFKWAAQEGYVDGSPCVNLPPLDPEKARTRVLTDEEIKTFWHGLDREDLGYERRIRLGLKFALASMLRTWELLGSHQNELGTHVDGTRCLDVPASRVKKKRVINQPLTSLALDVLKESQGNFEFLFAGRWGDAPLARQAMSNALAGRKAEGKKPAKKGICELLGLAPFTPHDLRRTAASLAGRSLPKDPGLSDPVIAFALDHQKETTVTGKVYNHQERKNMAEKRLVLERVERLLRQIVGLPATAKHRAPKRRAA